MYNALSLTSSKISLYYKRNESGFKQQKSYILPRSNTIKIKKGNIELSKAAKKKLYNAINWLVYNSAPRKIQYNGNRSVHNFQVSFVTLTLPVKQFHSSAEIKEKCLNRFFVDLRAKYNIKNYIWKAEFQKNGNIHFHVTLDKFVHYMALRQVWNVAIEVLGYVSKYQSKFINLTFEQYVTKRVFNSASEEQIRSAYNFGVESAWKKPNTTDVKKVRNVRQLAGYLTKYMAKGLVSNSKPTAAQKKAVKEFSGRIWFCSTSISRLGTVKLFYSMELRNIVYFIEKIKGVLISTSDYAKTILFGKSQLPAEIREWLRQELLSHAIKNFYPFPSEIPQN